MVPEILEEVLEKELEEAFEVKDKEAVRRYVKTIVSTFSPHSDIVDLSSEIKILAETMKQGFAFVEKRFEDINKRFEDMNKRFEDINKRFEDMNKRFDDMNKKFELLFWFVGLVFVVTNALIIIFKFLR